MKLYGIVMDTHRPYHNRRAYALMLKIFHDLKINGLYLIGDYADFYGVNGHGPKHPRITQMMVDEIDDVNKGLDELDKYFPRIPKHYIEGNHEWRLERYLINKAPELYGIYDIKHLFKMHERVNWRWYDYGPHQKTKVGGSKLWIRHEPPPGQIPQIPKAAGCNLVFGHIHRIVEVHNVTLKGDNHVAVCGGWMGDARMDKIFGYVKGHHAWQMGFVLVWVDEKSGYFYHHKVHIQENYTASVSGKLYRG